MKMLHKINIEAKLEPYRASLEAYVLSLRDIRNIGLLVFTIMVLLISWSGAKTIQSNYALQKQISSLQQQDQVRRLENTNQALQNEYYNTPQYLEVTARQNLGLAAPGETELLIPKDVALSHTVAQPKEAVTGKSTVPKQPGWQRNFQDWINFFLHRDS